MPTIVFHGKTYNSVDEMPENVREAYKHLMNIFVDKNGNGIPDFLEGDAAQNVITAFSGNFNVNGTTYNNVDELPEEMRTRVQSAFNMMAQMGLVNRGTVMPAMQMGGMQTIQQPQTESTSFDSIPSTPPPPVSSSSAIQEERGTGIFLWVVLGIVLCFLVVVAAFGVFYFMSR